MRVHKEENNQVLYVADYIRNEALSDLQTNGIVPGFHLAASVHYPSYFLNDYIPAAKELTRLYKENLINKVA
jgi:hypothetical protein